MPNWLTIWHIYGWQNNYWNYSADLGLQGFPPKDLHYSFLPQFTLMFYIRIREYSKVRLLYWMFSRYWSFYTIIDIELILEFKNSRGTKMKGNTRCFTDPAIFFPFFTLSNSVLLAIWVNLLFWFLFIPLVWSKDGLLWKILLGNENHDLK